MTVSAFTGHKQQEMGRRGPLISARARDPATGQPQDRRSIARTIPRAAALALGFAITILPAQAADEMPAEIIAVQIREQGYACDKALSAKREHPELDDAVWILKCDNASYRVRLIPDMAAKVERLD